ncbi:hypothetical protein THMIRHAT_20520 [Thiosulfativibrio zosterae]|uniref:Transport permease protein n=2 Tax=Thiosulfativibrio zosterae TaxID=2675053 RepID=A0A6F8PQE8_9GAMM|nr:hypothetical protein THMIRHAT_20520 [Thiosulfativibrio zosterae]
MGLLVTLLMFLTPIFYPLSAVKGSAGFWLSLNPMAVLIEALRSAILLNEWPPLSSHVYLWAFSLASLLVGTFVYLKLKRGFADVL